MEKPEDKMRWMDGFSSGGKVGLLACWTSIAEDGTYSVLSISGAHLGWPQYGVPAWMRFYAQLEDGGADEGYQRKAGYLCGRCCTGEKGNGHLCRAWENSGQKHMPGRYLALYQSILHTMTAARWRFAEVLVGLQHGETLYCTNAVLE